MDSSETSGTRWPPPPNHHHHPLQPPFLSPCNYNYNYHIHFSPQCPFHSRLLQQPQAHHHPSCPLSLSPPSPPTQALMAQGDGEAVIEKEDEEEPVFVLTDEWRDFFAKSEAKRKAAKKQAKKKGKQ